MSKWPISASPRTFGYSFGQGGRSCTGAEEAERKAIEAKTMSLEPESRVAATMKRRMSAAHSTRNPTGKLRLLNYRQMQDIKL